MDDLLVALCQRHGCFLRREALEIGYHDRAIAQLVRSGGWHRLRHGAYTLAEIWHSADPSLRHLMRCQAAYRTAATPVVLSHSSSLVMLRTAWWDLILDEVHLTRRDGKAGRREAGVVQHTGQILEGDVESRYGVDFMGATRTCLEITTMYDVERSLVVVNDLLHRRLTTQALLLERYAGMTRWPRTLHTDLVLRLCDDRIESVGESRSSHLFFRMGLPRPEPQWEVFDESGRLVGRVDFAWPDLRVFVEFDGRVKYERFLRDNETAVDVVLREKQRERAICEATGWECVRITWEDLQYPERTAARILAAFARSARRQMA